MLLLLRGARTAAVHHSWKAGCTACCIGRVGISPPVLEGKRTFARQMGGPKPNMLGDNY